MEDLSVLQDPRDPKQITNVDEAPTNRAAADSGVNDIDEDAADPQLAENEAPKGFDLDQEEFELGLDDGDLDQDVQK
ncbi:MAG: hypothetical protein REI78_14980 [Pedobacter sp.]|nr:hypothetical protein [Pedobacter sp.]MDQ8054333.1 hypothetical protein [Pedobacter sp.]